MSVGRGEAKGAGMSVGRFDALCQHLRDLWWENGVSGPVSGRIERGQTDAILADPLAHVDALVKAGVLEERGLPYRFNGQYDQMGAYPWFSVVQPEPPHEHEWRVVGITGAELRFECQAGGCRENRYVPNKLPIVVP